MVLIGVLIGKQPGPYLGRYPAQALDILPATVKTRVLRARRRLKNELAPGIRATLSGSFPFAGADCGMLTDGVVAMICDSNGG